MALSAAHAACVRQLSLRLHTLIRTRSCRHSGLMTSSSVPAHLRGLVLRQASSGAATPVTPTAATRTIWQPRISRAWLCGPTSGSVVQSHARAPDGPAAARVCDTGLPEPLGVLVARVSPGEDVTVVGWVRHVRRQKRVAFATVSDGSAGGTLQVVFNDPAHCPRELTTGAAVRLTGTVVASPRADHQAIELHVMSESGVEVVGACSGETYPLGGKSHSLEYLREKLHLRPRTARIGAVLRVRSALARALHAFFDSNHFFQVHTPLITTNDCEGGGETFNVTAPGYEAAHKAAPDGTSAMFFGGTAHLTVSGQLHAEAIATALSRVYTFGPTFRAENSTGTRHLAEFYMLEAEVAFAGLDAAVALAEGCVRHCAQELVGNARTAEDLALLWDQHHSGADVAASWTTTMSEPFARMSYTDAVRALSASGVDFRREVAWGDDLQHEHEQWLARELHGRPVVVYDYPKSLKPFYMRQNDDGATVAAFDLLVPGVGELVGGSAREERLDHLEAAIPRDALAGLDWYLDLRRFGTVPHAGFGLGFERLVQYFTGMANIRDVIPFPRHVGTCRL